MRGPGGQSPSAPGGEQAGPLGPGGTLPEWSEISALQDVAAVYANRFYITVGAATTRIAFGEALIGKQAHIRTAVLLSTTDATELAELLLKAITDTARGAGDRQDN